MPEVYQAVAVPLVDLTPVHAEVKSAILSDIAEIVEASAFHNGPHVAAFEEAFAAYHGTRHCIGVASGLDALRLALLALDIGPGDEVIVPAATFVASFEAVTQVGAVPVPVDIRHDDYTIDVDAVSAAVTGRTRAIMPVHLYGQLADMVALRDLAERKDIAILEDACQAHGATRDGILAGSGGTAAAFSFYAAKNLGAMGDAGALVTDDTQIAERMRSLREHGQREKYLHERDGYTSRLDTIQAAVLLHKLPRLDDANAQRAAAAAAYDQLLADVAGLTLPRVPPGSRPVWHLYVVQTSDPVALADGLRERRIGTGRHYPVPPHLTEAYASLGFGPGSFPVAEALSERALSLPIFPGITPDQVTAVADAVRDNLAAD